MKNTKILGCVLAITVFCFSSLGSAQSNSGWDNPSAGQGQPAAQPQPAGDGWATQPGQPQPQPQMAPPPQPVSQDVAVENNDSAQHLAEEKDKAYHLVGLRLRWIFVPKWFVTMFGVNVQSNNMGTPMVSNAGFGVEYTYRKNNFDITAAIWGAQLDWEEPLSFKKDGEPTESWTVVTNDMAAILFTADFIWSTPIKPWVAITYGVGVGFGIRTGKIVETEATVASGGIEPCNGPNDPNDSGCEWDGEYNEKWDKMPVVPWINFLVGARFKPHEHVAIYVDGGFGLGFQMGIRGGYIF